MKPHVSLRQSSGATATDLEHLASRLGARPREAAGAEPDDLGEVDDGGDLDQLSLHAQLAEEDDPARRAAGQGRKSASNAPVLLPVRALVERRAEPIDPEPLRALRLRRERPTKRLLAGDQAAAKHGHEHRERERNPADDERGPEWLRAQPRARDGKRRPRRTKQRLRNGLRRCLQRLGSSVVHEPHELSAFEVAACGDEPERKEDARICDTNSGTLLVS